MRLTELRVGVSQTINLEPITNKFESIRPSVEVSATLDEGDDPSEVFSELARKARTLFQRLAILELRGAENRRNVVSPTQWSISQLKELLYGE